eukprot:CAMPEP_0198302870 /NCGR_PEP_ID=MMETSP1449-20131203/56590_1 /TAXON_ID=420275 /ORGANISM="Attheya septentrionalis, Strain CCMP2084" /LENGTH=462 /DNA_ID=CAMNT_0044005343 /DNA_START=250 /DNA_END=1638 /DNA_ORIENTATION=-
MAPKPFFEDEGQSPGSPHRSTEDDNEKKRRDNEEPTANNGESDSMDDQRPPEVKRTKRTLRKFRSSLVFEDEDFFDPSCNIEVDERGMPIAPLEMQVLGIFCRGEIPRKELLPKEPVLKDYKKDQVMVRRRMNVRPFLDDEDDANYDLDHDEEEEKKSEDEPKVQIEFEKALFLPSQGLAGNRFWHNDEDEHSDESRSSVVFEERAILFQSIENYQRLINEPTLAVYFLPTTEKMEGGFDQTQDAIELILDEPRFGEQVIVKGCSANDIAIGDRFEVEGGFSTLKLEVSSPRLPCSYVDKRNGSPFGLKGVKRFAMTNGLAGFFTRVLEEGELQDGMRLVRTSHPHPKWTLSYISMALYGEGGRRRLMKGEAYWAREESELRELCNLKELGVSEWKEEADYILEYWDESSTDEEGPAKQAPIARKKVPAVSAETGYFEHASHGLSTFVDSICSYSSGFLFCA